MGSALRPEPRNSPLVCRSPSLSESRECPYTGRLWGGSLFRLPNGMELDIDLAVTMANDPSSCAKSSRAMPWSKPVHHTAVQPGVFHPSPVCLYRHSPSHPQQAYWIRRDKYDLSLLHTDWAATIIDRSSSENLGTKSRRLRDYDS